MFLWMELRSYAPSAVHYVQWTQPQVQANCWSIGIGHLSLFCGQFGPIKIDPFRRLFANGRCDVKRIIATLAIGR
jgi:hypothetical protein